MIVVIEVGCLECGEATTVPGVYASIAAAREAHVDARWQLDTGDDWYGAGVLMMVDVGVVPPATVERYRWAA